MKKQIKLLIVFFILSSFYVLACSDDSDGDTDSDGNDDTDSDSDGDSQQVDHSA